MCSLDTAPQQIVGPEPPARASHQSDPVLSWRVLAGGGPVKLKRYAGFPMTLISPQLTRIPGSLRGDWIRRWNRNIWEGEISCTQPFVTLIVARVREDLFWAKSLPSKDNALEVTLDLFPRPDLEDRLFQLSFSSGSGAFINNVTAKFGDPDYRPDISVANQFETGVVVPFVIFNSRLGFSLVCIAKSDVVVRRRYVWGLKPHLLSGINSPWREILTKGRAGSTALRAAA